MCVCDMVFVFPFFIVHVPLVLSFSEMRSFFRFSVSLCCKHPKTFLGNTKSARVILRCSPLCFLRICEGERERKEHIREALYSLSAAHRPFCYLSLLGNDAR